MTPDTTPSCSRCRHRTAFGACGQPVAAGLAPRFQIVKHPAGGAGCPAFRPHRSPLEARVERLVRSGVLGLDDRDEALALLRAERGDELAQLLDLVERAEGRR